MKNKILKNKHFKRTLLYLFAYYVIFGFYSSIFYVNLWQHFYLLLILFSVVLFTINIVYFSLELQNNILIVYDDDKKEFNLEKVKGKFD